MRKIVVLLISILLLNGCINNKEHVNTNDEKINKHENVEKLNQIDFEVYDNEIIPSRINIPGLNVDERLDHTSTNENGEMSVPHDINTPAWFKDGYKVGDLGNAVIAGHVDDGVNPGVFTNLHKLQKGDKVEVSDRNNKKLVFKVYDKKLYKLRDAPVEKIFGFSSNRHLNLITCEGDYNTSLGSTPNRLVVYTKLING